MRGSISDAVAVGGRLRVLSPWAATQGLIPARNSFILTSQIVKYGTLPTQLYIQMFGRVFYYLASFGNSGI